ncbi:sigma-70 family RNA polymerase sigma factor [Sphingomonas sp. HF-S4]|uniref:Sigma-70 family RNA polymerase sigma factor n=1 Tax=Sphingomonas agrestis TaxID=3080540 RepID=A0ABU3Y3E9_9SPHN|nr:sigma-70 family RNA polymerase sigma factor [Sphingomonas sp. HF-S4]MDV3455899.1 sigma-70 family RNA polymerase sigma factor [Sphingomonas sp. HF-S4]
MEREYDIVARWVAREILPHENRVRVWLTRQWRGAVDVDDVLQEAYCRLSSLKSIEHIENPLAYFRRAAHAAAVDAVRHTNKNIVSMTEKDWFDVLDENPSVERQVEDAQELSRVGRVLASLSDTCRRVIELRRIEGLSQRETAERLGISENVVENNIVRGIRRVLAAMADQDAMTGEDADQQEDARIGKRRSQ